MREHQLRTYRAYNLHLVDAVDCLGGVWPAIKPSYARPDRMTTFYPKSAAQNSDAFCHFFIDDYRFEKVWREPERYVPVLKKYAGAIMPDFSTYHIMPLPMQWWNMYRNRALMYYWQQEGIDVIPYIGCGDPRTYDYAFEGLPIGGTYAVSNNGLMQSEYNRKYFIESLLIAIDAVKPDLLCIYGKRFDVSLPCEVIWYKNDNTARVRTNCPALPLGSRKELQSALDGVINADAYEGSRTQTHDGCERAISTLRPDERNPLMYNEELPGYKPYYADDARTLITSNGRLLLTDGDGQS